MTRTQHAIALTPLNDMHPNVSKWLRYYPRGVASKLGWLLEGRS
jgi:hypothetical protein